MSEARRRPLPHPRRGLRGHFPARGARQPFQEQFKRADVRTQDAVPRPARSLGMKVRTPGPGARGWASRVSARTQSPAPSPGRGRGCGRSTRKRGAPGAEAQRPCARSPGRSRRGRGVRPGCRGGGGLSRTGPAAASPPPFSPLPLPSLCPAVPLLSPPPSESRALL